jgi:hypothetical protein
MGREIYHGNLSDGAKDFYCFFDLDEISASSFCLYHLAFAT